MHPLHLGAAACSPHAGVWQWSCAEPAATETFLSRRASLCLGPCSPSLQLTLLEEQPCPVCHIQPCPVPILCFCHPSAPLLFTAVPPSCSPCPQLLSCSALELPDPRLAKWAAAAQTLWGFLLHPVQPLSLLLCCRMTQSLWTSLTMRYQRDRESDSSLRTPAPLCVPVSVSWWSVGGCYKHDGSRINVEANFRLALVVMSSRKEEQGRERAQDFWKGRYKRPGPFREVG